MDYQNINQSDAGLGYPVWSREAQFEGSTKRFTSMPTPIDVYNYAMLGLPNIFPLINEQIPMSVAEDALNSAITEIEMSTGMDITPVTHYHKHDLIDGLLTNSNFMGMSLFRWPATKVIKIALKYPNVTALQSYQEYVFPSAWISLVKNKVNVIPSFGSIGIIQGQQGPGFAGISLALGVNQAYRPNLIEVVYTAGFENDKMPTAVADFIKTWAAYRMLNDIGPLLFPYSNVSVSIDAVSQSAGFNLTAIIAGKILALDAKRNQLKSAIMTQFKSPISKSFVGA